MISSRISTLSPSRADAWLARITRALAMVATVVVLLITVFLVLEAWPALRRVGLARFFTDASWHPRSGRYNLAPMLLGSLLVTAGSVAVAAPLGIL